MSEIREAVRERYASAAKQIAAGCCAPEAAGTPGCCEPGGDGQTATSSFVKDYSDADTAEVGLSRRVSLGCGNPTALAELHEGERVLDLGSGGGLDVLLSARRVGATGHAYGVDMTDEMLELAERNRSAAGAVNVTFLRGTIEAVPLPAETIDVVISNCVINLAEDKGAVIAEAFRLLRPGGRFAVADMVEVEALAPAAKAAADQWSGCIAGTIPIGDYRDLLGAAGFVEVDIDVHTVTQVPGGGRVGSAYIRGRKPAATLRGEPLRVVQAGAGACCTPGAAAPAPGSCC